MSATSPATRFSRCNAAAPSVGARQQLSLVSHHVGQVHLDVLDTAVPEERHPATRQTAGQLQEARGARCQGQLVDQLVAGQQPMLQAQPPPEQHPRHRRRASQTSPSNRDGRSRDWWISTFENAAQVWLNSEGSSDDQFAGACQRDRVLLWGIGAVTLFLCAHAVLLPTCDHRFPGVVRVPTSNQSYGVQVFIGVQV